MIEIRNLAKSFGAVEAVRDLTLDIPAGELFCFLGPNGAGKTTTIKMLTGLLRPSRGTIRIGGVDLARDPVTVKRRIGYIPDMPFVYDRLTPVEFLRFTGDLYDIPAARVDAAIDDSFRLFGLDASRRALIRDLSHGMRQRLIYCSTFLHEPSVLFIDEPLIGLDPRSIRLIKDLLREKARGGMTIFLTTHILALAEDIADRIGIIDGGRLIALGPLDDLRRRSGVDGSLEDLFLILTREAEPPDAAPGEG